MYITPTFLKSIVYIEISFNLCEEFDKFKELNGKYDPQFKYTFDRVKLPYRKPHSKFLKEARAILDSTLYVYGSDEAYFDSFGPVVGREETEYAFNSYINSLEVGNLLTCEFTTDTVS